MPICSSLDLKPLLLILLLCSAGIAAFALARSAAHDDPPNPITTTIFVVRHAQKADPNDNAPEAKLSEQGQQAARRLAAALRSADIKAVFATPTLRARETAQPTATIFGLQVTEYQGAEPVADRIQRDWSGRSVLVVGHSNTVPAIVRALGGSAEGELRSDEYDNLFVVTITELHGLRSVATTRLRLPE